MGWKLSFLRYSRTFWIQSDQASSPRRVTIRGLHLFVCLVIAGAALAGAVRLGLTAAEGIAKSRELDALRGRARDQAIALQSLQSRVEDLNLRLENLREAEAKIRTLLGSPTPKGMGGPEISEPPPRPASQASPSSLNEELTRTLEAFIRQESIFQDLMEEAVSRKSYWAAIPTLWPVYGAITSGFGHRISPFTGNVTMHNGLDIAAPPNAVVRAPADGVVMFAGFDSGLGRTVRIFHGFGLETFYGHLSSIAVRTGQRIQKGTRIGAVGSTGLSTGPHLHYQVTRNGVPVNPLRYLLN